MCSAFGFIYELKPPSEALHCGIKGFLEYFDSISLQEFLQSFDTIMGCSVDLIFSKWVKYKR